MTLYAGGDYRIVASATLDGEPMTAVDVDDVLLAGFREGGTEVLADTPMAYDAVAGRWVAVWATPDQPGDYWARVTVVDLLGNRAPTFLRLRLRANPAA